MLVKPLIDTVHILTQQLLYTSKAIMYVYTYMPFIFLININTELRISLRIILIEANTTIKIYMQKLLLHINYIVMI